MRDSSEKPTAREARPQRGLVADSPTTPPAFSWGAAARPNFFNKKEKKEKNIPYTTHLIHTFALNETNSNFTSSPYTYPKVSRYGYVHYIIYHKGLTHCKPFFLYHKHKHCINQKKKNNNPVTTNPMKLAIQKSGRLYEASMQLLTACGISVAHSKNQLRVRASNFDLEIFFLRDDDIPQYVADNVAHIGIVGRNVLVETGYQVTEVTTLGFGACNLCIAIGKHEAYPNNQYLQGKRIATSYPNILQAYLAKHHITADVHVISGSVEIAPKIGLADAICDIVSSGSTLFMNELKPVETIFTSQAVLIANTQLSTTEQALLQQLTFRIQAVNQAANYKYILLNIPTDKLATISALLPSMKSPTVLPLAQAGWCSVHTVVAEQDFWNKIEILKANGAEGILVIPIEKMIL